MIARFWRGYSTLEKANGYRVILLREVPHINKSQGYGGTLVLERKINGEIEFLIITLWESMDAVRQFAVRSMSALSFMRTQPLFSPAATRNRFTTPFMKSNNSTVRRTACMLSLFLVFAMTTLAQPTDDKNVLLRMERDWNNALKSKDVSWFEQNLTDDLTDTSSGSGALHNKAEDIAALKKDKTVYDSLELSNLQVRIEGNAGIVTGVNHLRGRDEKGEAFDVKLSFTDTYVKRDGRWFVWASQHTRLRE